MHRIALIAILAVTACDDSTGPDCGPTGLTVDDYLPADMLLMEEPARSCAATMLIAAARAADCLDADGQALIGEQANPAWVRQYCERHPEAGIYGQRCNNRLAADACGELRADCRLSPEPVREACW